MKNITPKRTGRPSDGEDRPKLKLVAFRFDAETEDALALLVAHATKDARLRLVRGGLKSALVRRLIVDAAARLRAIDSES